MPILADLLSFIDSTKRSVKGRLSDLMDNPGDYYQMVDDQAKNYNRTVQPTIQGGSLFNRPMTEAEKDQRSIDLALNVGPMGVGHIAYHGSPHKFDKFSLDKIGTGEGAQAYGHGLYLAESPDVANQYATALSNGKARGSLLYEVTGTPKDDYGVQLKKFYDDHSPASGTSYLDNIPVGGDFKSRREAIEEFKRVTGKNDGDFKLKKEGVGDYSKIIITPKEQLYKTDIPDEAVARFLDWDKPLSQQAPEVQAAFESRVSPIRAEMAKPADPGWGDLAAPSNFDPTGQELLGLLRNRDASLTAQQFLGNGLGPDISTALKQQGIPGIRYLDGGSRSAGQGSSNFVAFDPEMIRILERNGQATGLEPWKPGEYSLKDLITK